jgi:hypothetical protein
VQIGFQALNSQFAVNCPDGPGPKSLRLSLEAGSIVSDHLETGFELDIARRAVDAGFADAYHFVFLGKLIPPFSKFCPGLFFIVDAGSQALASSGSISRICFAVSNFGKLSAANASCGAFAKAAASVIRNVNNRISGPLIHRAVSDKASLGKIGVELLVAVSQVSSDVAPATTIPTRSTIAVSVAIRATAPPAAFAAELAAAMCKAWRGGASGRRPASCRGGQPHLRFSSAKQPWPPCDRRVCARDRIARLLGVML